MKHGKKIPTDDLIDEQVVLHPVISSWRNTLTVDTGLLTSIKNEGQIEDIIFRTLGDKFELVAGSRRYFHQKILGTSFEDIPKKIKELTDQQALKIAAAENIFRKDFNKWEEAKVISDLVKVGKIPMRDLAKQMGVTQQHIKNRIALMELPEKITAKFEKKDVPIGFAGPVKALKKYPEAQMELVNKIIETMDRSYGGIRTVEDATEFVEKVKKQVKDREDLLKQYGPCPKCESTDIKKAGWGEEEKLACRSCGHSWHGVTREPWEYYETKQKLEKMGIKVEEGPDTLTLTPKDVLDIAQKEANKKEVERIAQEIEDGEKEPELPEKFRSKIPLEIILAPLIHENLQKIQVKGSTIEIDLIEDCDMHFKGLKKDYRAGEKARIEMSSFYGTDETKKVHELINGLTASAAD